MSTVKSLNYQVGQSITTTNNFTMYQPASPDGTVRWGVGNAGSVTDLVVLNSSGNLGLGVTPSAWGVNQKAVQVGTFASLYNDDYTGAAVVGHNVYQSANTTYNYKFTGQAASRYSQGGGIHVWYTAPSGTAGNPISFTQAMTLDASGNLGVGATSPTARIHSNASIKADQNVFSGDGYAFVFGSGTTSYWTGSSSTNYMAAFTSGTERMRIDSSGNLLVGTTTLGGLYGFSVSMQSNGAGTSAYAIFNASASTSYPLVFRFNGAGVGNVSYTSTSTTYSTSSDYRLKENVKPMQNALATVAQLNPVTYNWKADGSDGQGFIAHELQAVVPDCVTGEKDAVDKNGKPIYQGIDTSFLVATLTKAIQELNAKVESLEAQLKGNA